MCGDREIQIELTVEKKLVETRARSKSIFL